MTDFVFPAEYLGFCELFNRGEFWESHEVLEGPWRASRSPFYHGLILLASAYVHVQRGNPKGVAAQLRKALRELPAHRPAYLGLDVGALVEHAERALRAVEADPRQDQLSKHLPVLVLRPHPALARGDEPELAGA
jgi:predicted metal-dependent hydrolase